MLLVVNLGKLKLKLILFICSLIYGNCLCRFNEFHSQPLTLCSDLQPLPHFLPLETKMLSNDPSCPALSRPRYHMTSWNVGCKEEHM